MKRKLVLLTALTMSVVLLVLDVFIYVLLARHLDTVQQANLANKVDAVAQYALGQTETGSGNPQPNYGWLRQYVTEGEAALILSPKGMIEGSLGKVTVPIAKAVPLHPSRKTVRRVVNGNQTFIVAVEPMIDTDAHHLTGYAVMISDTATETDYMKILAVVLSFGTTGAVIVMSIGALLIATFTLRPLHQMMQTVTRIEADNLDERVPVPKAKDLVSAFAEAFNRMLARIERSFEQQSRFVADASHEIRTPLTNIRGYANLLRRWGKHNPDVLDECIEVIDREAKRLQDLSESLLLTARLEASMADAPGEADVDALLNEVVMTKQPLYPDRKLGSSLQSGATVRMSPEHFRRVCSNLIDNALKYTPPGRSVQVTSTTLGAFVKVIVADTGIGIPEADLPRIFERFYRVDKARSKEHGGVGLGLSLVKELVERHGGTVKLESELGVGTTAEVTLPINREEYT